MRREILRAAWIDRSEVELARRLACGRNHVSHRLVGRGGWNHQQHCEARRNGDLRKIFEHVVRHALEQAHADRLSVPHFAERVSVCWSTQHGPHGGDSSSARPILDDKRLLQVLTELVCEQPDGHIAGAAGPVGHEDADRLAWIVAGRLGGIAQSGYARKRRKRRKSRCAAEPTRRLCYSSLIESHLTYRATVPASYIPTKTLPASSAATDSPQLLLAAPVPSFGGAGSGMKAVTLPSFTLPIRTPRLKPGFCAMLDSESVT